MEAKINEIFSSIQGEGPVVGYKQLFIRFCGCNLSCAYCDTEFNNGKTYTPQELYNKITSNYDLNNIHSISLTGGEPLLHTDFLKEFLPLLQGQSKIYLETNATLCENFLQIKKYADIISADIKLKSSTGNDTFDLHERFLKETEGIYTFAKIVFDENITQYEIEKSAQIAKKFDIEITLQPKMTDNKMSVSSDFCNKILDKYLSIYKNVRLIPQVHKFINVR